MSNYRGYLPPCSIAIIVCLVHPTFSPRSSWLISPFLNRSQRILFSISFFPIQKPADKTNKQEAATAFHTKKFSAIHPQETSELSDQVSQKEMLGNLYVLPN